MKCICQLAGRSRFGCVRRMSFTVSFLPNLRVKQDAVPGMAIEAMVHAQQSAGTYEIACAELCGLGHYRMKGALTVDESQAEL